MIYLKIYEEYTSRLWKNYIQRSVSEGWPNYGSWTEVNDKLAMSPYLSLVLLNSTIITLKSV